MDPELSIIIPAYNEGEHLEEVVTEMVQALDASGISYEIRIVNNGSSDGTADAIERLERTSSHVTHVYLRDNRHYGGGIAAGFAEAQGSVLGWVDADGQADPSDIPRLYRAMRQEGCELAKGIRKMRPEAGWRRIQSIVYNIAFRVLFFSGYRDINAKPKLLTRAAKEKLDLQSRDFFLDPEFVIQALRKGMPICEIETNWRKRVSGSSTTNILSGLRFMQNMIAYRLGLK